MILFGRPTSVNVQKVLWALDELGLDYEHETVGGKYGGYDRPEFDAAPLHRVPLLVDGEDVLWESHAILRHLARKTGRMGAPETLVDMWMEFGSTTLQPEFIGIFYQHVRLPLQERSLDVERKHRVALSRGLQGLERHLSDGRAFIAGEALTMADVAVGAMMFRLIDLAPETVDPASHIDAWHGRLAARPAWDRWIATSYEELRAP